MVADAFTIFDYSSSHGETAFLAMFIFFTYSLMILLSVDLWVSTNLGGSMMLWVYSFLNKSLSLNTAFPGFILTLLGVSTYMSAMGVMSCFPTSFSPLWHFSHNLMISFVLWTALMLMELEVGGWWFISRFTIPGLFWLLWLPVVGMEIIGYMLRALILGARLTMNLMAGKLMLVLSCSFLSHSLVTIKVFSSICAASCVMILSVWEMASVLIQILIFITLLSSYSKESVSN
nr:ATP6 [Donax semistriatus]